MSAEVIIFASLFKYVRDLAQLVAHTSGGREVAGSSPVIPTLYRELVTVGYQFFFFLVSKPEPTGGMWAGLILHCLMRCCLWLSANLHFRCSFAEYSWLCSSFYSHTVFIVHGSLGAERVCSGRTQIVTYMLQKCLFLYF